MSRRSCLLAIAIGAGLLAQRAHAELTERMVAFGDELSQLSAAVGPETTIALNGARVVVHVSTLSMPLEGVSAGFEALCDSAAPSVSAALRSVHVDRSYHGVIHAQSADAISAACLAQPQAADLTSVASRWAEYTQTGDLSVFGHPRYLIARRLTGDQTRIWLASSDTPLRLTAMFPASGDDASGDDLTELPRPAAAQRVLSAQVVGQPHGLVAYRVASTPASALDDYARALTGRGFRQGERSQSSAGALTTSFMHGEAQFIVRAFASRSGTVLIAVRMPAANNPQEARGRVY
jgi:hypothetical protein